MNESDELERLQQSINELEKTIDSLMKQLRDLERENVSLRDALDGIHYMLRGGKKLKND